MKNRAFATLSLLFLLLAASAVHAQAENLTIWLDVPGVSEKGSDPISDELHGLLVKRVSELAGEAVVMGRPGSYVIYPTTVVASANDTVTWMSSAPFVVHFNERTPIRGERVTDNVTIQGGLDSEKKVYVAEGLPIGDVEPGVYTYSVAIYKDGKVFIHVSGEVKKRP